MPSTYNGIGTHYYGKKNIEKRPGPCPHCNGATELTSYDTRLWFVVLFIPVFPLGRKRIVDYCPSCTRHYAVDARKWETSKQLEISGAMDEYRAKPTAEGAIAVHQQFCKFHQTAQAAEFQKKMVEEYAGNAKVQAYLGAALEHFGKLDEATAFYAKALELRPDLPEARIGVALSHIRAGRLDEARGLLDFLEKKGAAQLNSLQPLETLAIGYQHANRHVEALELFGTLQVELPHIAEVKAFRDMVKKSETALGKKETMLPEQKFSWRRFFGMGRNFSGASPQVTWRSLAILGVILGLIALGLVIANENIRRHRKVYFVNAFAQPAKVELEGVNKGLTVRKLNEMELPEGRYRAIITGPVRQELDFEVRSAYLSRWWTDPAWVINVGGAAVLVKGTVVYAADPPPPTFSLHYGKPFEHFPRVTHAFKDLPDSVRMKRSEKRTLVHLDFYAEPSGAAAFRYELENSGAEQAFILAESWLKAHPGDKELLRLYAENSQKSQPERLENFLRGGLTNRPVQIDWHRAYQRRHEKSAELGKLIADYDEMLRVEPTNSALLYLRGRIETNRGQSRAFFKRAVEADPKNAFAHFGLGYDRMSAGDWPAARTHLARAVELSPEEQAFAHSLLLMRLTLGEAATVEQETRDLLRKKPLDYATEVRLMQALIAQGNRERTLAELSDFEKGWLAQHGVRQQQPVIGLKRFVLYGLGDFAELEKLATKDKSSEGRRELAVALIEQGRVEEAMKIESGDADSDEKSWRSIEMSIACRSAGHAKEAEEYLERAIKTLANGNEDLAHAATFLSRATPPTDEELDGVVLPPQNKAIFLATLAHKHPSATAHLLALARKFNIERRFPYHLLNRVTATNQAGNQ